MDSTKTNASRRRSIQDRRRSVQEPRKSSLPKVTPEALRVPLPQRRPARDATANVEQPKLHLMCMKTVDLSEKIIRLWTRIIHLWSVAATKLCAAGHRRGTSAQERRNTDSAPRRWYRVYPISDTSYSVRADAGMGGRIPGQGFSQDSAYRQSSIEGCSEKVACYRSSQPPKRHWSLPPAVERGIGLPSDVLDDLRGVCKICCDQQNEVVVLPCRHGGMCEKCLRRAVYSKPLHRGGLTCPMCRRDIWEVIRIYDEAVRPQYGYSIMVSPAWAPVTCSSASRKTAKADVFVQARWPSGVTA